MLTTSVVDEELRAKDADDSAEIENFLSSIEILPALPLDPMLGAIMG